MKLTTTIVLALGVLGLGAGVVMATRPSSGVDSETDKSKARKIAIDSAVDNLSEQLQKRFHDRNNVDFGMSRMVRTGFRMHFAGPEMDRVQRFATTGPNSIYRRTADKKDWEMKDDETGEWVPANSVRKRLHVENPVEKAAVQQIDALGVEVSLYTFGQFNLSEDQEKRSRGPAYLHQRGITAPPAAGFLGLAEQAYTADADQSRIGSADGWTYYARRVKADDKSCLNCHNAMARYDGHRKELKNPKQYKIGDTIGILLLGVHDDLAMKG